MSRESITKQHKREAKLLAQQRQKDLQNKVKVQVDHNTWIYLPKKLARSKRKLKAYLAARAERIREKKDQEEQIRAGRIARNKAAAKARRLKKKNKK
ncbi:hypothetical protein [Microscilla marina]|uniref:BZIP domain-containing protein n=1 Tax=Microscilla marina ATCC 23134 TaxID=313606 RepID=A1ZIE8_MICM2|nr:hypothetical protein [Microscilla marina]EAY29816.1 hypothetical protein M23134_05689 [Microscilla marina ATCC 23134]